MCFFCAFSLKILGLLMTSSRHASDVLRPCQIFDGSKSFSVEPKYDGERILAHLDAEVRAAWLAVCRHKISSLPTAWLIFPQFVPLVFEDWGMKTVFLMKRRLGELERLGSILLLNIDPNHPLQAKRVELLGVFLWCKREVVVTKKGTFLTH